ncbi:MAG TPA: S46 family peptidase [Thermoanaerobaculia bacterium]
MRKLTTLIALLCVAPVAIPAMADEGMWLFNKPPLRQLQERYNFTPSPAWLEHLQKSAVRFNNGGSASFVSNEGLIITNHHVGFDCIQKLSTAERDLVANGFRAKTRAEELQCPDLEINVLMSIEDVTTRVSGATKPGMSSAEAEAATRATLNAIEKESLEKTGLRSDVVTLYQGGQYHLYRYKKYTDVRLVFAPEEDIAFFGGDPDNFEYPRFNLDISFFRAYENGKPARPDAFLKWSPEGAKEGELVVVAGHPGTTERLNTVAHLESMRDVSYPWLLNYLRRQELLLEIYSERGKENARRAKDDLLSIENARKSYDGSLGALQDPALIASKRADEQRLRQTGLAGDAFDMIERAVAKSRAIYVERQMLSSGYAFGGDLFNKARAIVRLAEETAKPNAQRLREYRDSNLESLKYGLLADSPIYGDLETAKLADSLSFWMESMPGDPLIAKVLNGKSPRQRAVELVQGTGLANPAIRKELVEGGKAKIDASKDPMLVVARLVDARARELRKQQEEEVQEPLRQAYAKIANAKFRAGGENLYPDATFTLRLSFGAVKGYRLDPYVQPWSTTFAGLYDRSAQHEREEPWDLPKSWTDAQSKIDLKVPFNFVATIDSVGGNSGSPVVNRNGEFVGILFDGNPSTLGYSFAYQDVDARAIAVHGRGILEALKSVYGATELLTELKK